MKIGFDYRSNEEAREELEHDILTRRPYDWKTHFMFDLPDLFLFLGKWIAFIILGTLILQAIIGASINVTIQELPTFCEKMK